VACASAPEKPLNAPAVLGDAPDQLVQAHSGPAGSDASAIAGEQPVAVQFPHRALYGVLFAAPLFRLNPKGKLKDRELRGMQEQSLREDRPFHDLVLMGGRKQAPPDIVVVHGKALLSCATPPGLPQTVAGGILLRICEPSTICVHIYRKMYAETLQSRF
jgi:hypothetical protein